MLRDPIRRVVLFALVPFALGVAAPRDVHTYTVILTDPPVGKLAPESFRSREGVKDQQRAALTAAARTVEDGQRALSRTLETQGVKTIGAVQHVLNAVFIRATEEQAARVRALPGVRRVAMARRFKPLVNAGGEVVRAPAAREAVGGNDEAGLGWRIAVLDTGLDHTHPALQDPSLDPPDGFPKGRAEDLPYTNEKIIAARSYVHLLNPEEPEFSRPDDETPRDRIGHGTAVAMIAAGRPVDSPVGELVGVAPKAFLGNYKIFGSPDVNEFSNDAAIIAAIDDAVLDGFDVLTISFGAIAQYPFDAGGDVCSDDDDTLCDPVAMAAQSAVIDFGVVIAAAAGNAGAFGEQSFPTQNSISTPATAPAVIAVGASLNSRQLLESVRFNGRSAEALEGVGLELTQPLTAPGRRSAAVGDALACSEPPAGSLAGAIAVIERGGCDLEFKIDFAAGAGAVAAVIINLEGQDSPEIMLGLETTGIPAYMVGHSEGRRLADYLAANPDGAVTLDPTLQSRAFATDQVSPFSSRGPSVAGFIKPDIVAPGTFIYSAAQRLDPNGDSYSESAFVSVDGTSFAAPFAAGAAALVWSQHPDWTSTQVKSALVNTASPVLVEDGEAARVTSAGAGLLDVANALNPIATAEPATLSFGDIRGQSLPIELDLFVTNTRDVPGAYRLTVVPRDTDPRLSVRINGSNFVSLGLSPGETQRVTVALTGSQPPNGQYEGVIQIARDAGGLELLVPYYYAVGDGVPANAFALTGTGVVGTVGEPHPELLILKAVDQYGQPAADRNVNWSVDEGGGSIFESDPATDGFGVAAADVDLGPTPGFQDFLATVAGLEVPFLNEARSKPQIGGIVNGASFEASRPVAPGSIISIFGDSLAEFQGHASTIPLPLALKHVSVSFDFPEEELSLPGRLFFTSDGQINVQVPWELAGLNFALVKVRIEDSASEPVTLDLADAAPGLFEYDAGAGPYAAATHADGSLITPDDPARPGETIIVYATGLGPVDDPPPTGEAAPADRLVRTLSTPAASIGGRGTTVDFSGLAPGYVGLYQLNLAVPDGPAGDVMIEVEAGGRLAKPVRLPVAP